MAPDPARYPRTILVSCPVPWDDEERMLEDLFREQVRRLVERGFRDLYVFGTGGEGYAVDTARFAQVVRVFREATDRPDVRAMVGLIGLSTAIVLERLATAHAAGFRAFQVSLPSWGRLADAEMDRFFADVLGRYPDSLFLHYNLGRTGRVLGGADYRRLVERHPNLVATKLAAGGAAHALELHRDAPELRHFLDVDAFGSGALSGPCGLLASYAPLAPHRCRELFEAGLRGDVATLASLEHGFVALGSELWAVPAPGPHMDGAYDKMLLRLGIMPEFPLRLLSPYAGFSDEDARRCRALLEERFPSWLPPAG